MNTSTNPWVKNLDAIPAFPASVARLSLLLNNDLGSLKPIVDIITTDPALTTNLLRVANSPVFRGRQVIHSVSEAVTRLGTRRVYELATCGWLQKTVPAKFPLYEEGSDSFLAHSIACAVYSKRIADAVGGAAESFTTGLLHDIGKLVVAVGMQNRKTAFKQPPPGTLLLDGERMVLGVDHTDVGLAITRKWSLPPIVCDAIKWHHSPRTAPEHVRKLAAIVHSASSMAHVYGFGVDGSGLARAVEPQATEQVGISEDSLDTIATDARTEIENILVALNLRSTNKR